LVCVLPVLWILWIVFRYLQRKYYENIHPWVTSVKNWIRKICQMIWNNVVFKLICYIVSTCFVYATREGATRLVIVSAIGMNFYYSTSMGVRKCESNLRLWEKMDNYTGSNTHLIKVAHQLNMLCHPDIESLQESSNQTLINRSVKEVLLYMQKYVFMAKHDFALENNHMQMFGMLISKVPQCKYLGMIVPYSPYLLGYWFQSTRMYLWILLAIVYFSLYVWYLCIRCLEFGIFGAFCDWNTCCHLLVPYGMWISYTSWVGKPQTESQELGNANLQQDPPQRRTARGRSPRRRQAS